MLPLAVLKYSLQSKVSKYHIKLERDIINSWGAGGGTTLMLSFLYISIFWVYDIRLMLMFVYYYVNEKNTIKVADRGSKKGFFYGCVLLFSHSFFACCTVFVSCYKNELGVCVLYS